MSEEVAVSGLGARRRIRPRPPSIVIGCLVIALVVLGGSCVTSATGRASVTATAAVPTASSVTSTPPGTPATPPSPLTAPATPSASTPPSRASTYLALSGASFADATHGWIIGQRCGRPGTPTPSSTPPCAGLVEATGDGGRTWSAQSLGDPRLIPVAVQAADAEDAWIAATTVDVCGAGPCATVLYSTANGGRTWNAAYHTGPSTASIMVNGRPVMARSVALTSLALVPGHGLWAFGTACAGLVDTSCRPVAVASPDGRGFSQVALPTLPPALHATLAHPTASDAWIAAGADVPGAGRIVASHDGGKTWQTLPDPAPTDPWQALTFRSATEGWLLSGSVPGAGQQIKTLYHTTNGGRTWQRVAGGPFNATPIPGTALPTSGYVGPLVFPTPTTGWIASPRGGLLHSSDGGRTWARVRGVTCGDLTCQSVGFASPTVGWVVSNGGLWLTTDGGAVWRQARVPGEVPVQ
ncbi:MAG TPA: hypothetical protein VFN57_01205 [Thermomicrobiaceae bacterium]|nr:hypothetical protein [Thermomicrobiaceae bacterium]